VARAARQAVLPLLALLAACHTFDAASPPAEPGPLAAPPAGPAWRGVVLDADADRLSRLDAAWSAALAAARAAGFARRIAAEGPLLVPASAQPRPTLPPGSYRCRVIRFGGAAHAFTAYPPYFCHVGVEGDELSFTKQTGSERPGGYLWADTDRRMVFLGAVAEGDERGPPAYGTRPEQDLAGIVERIAPMRYRLVVPWPQNGAKLDVIELIPWVPLPD
jgi:hypothetical protein